jgi:hypothetical protein
MVSLRGSDLHFDDDFELFMCLVTRDTSAEFSIQILYSFLVGLFFIEF